MVAKKTPPKGGSKAKPTAKKAPPKKTAAKKIKVKSNVPNEAINIPCKPIFYLEDGQIPTSMSGSKVGSTVDLKMKGKIIRRSESQDKGGTITGLCIEVSKVTPGKKGK